MGAMHGLLRRPHRPDVQRLIEIWGAMPELYLLIIFASIFEPSLRCC
jgi:microcin C transport system permease protein